MANVQKCKCKECKRTISIKDMFCPYCSTPNPFSTDIQKPPKVVPKASMTDDLEAFLAQENLNDSSFDDENDDSDSIEDLLPEVNAVSEETENNDFTRQKDDESDEYEDYQENFGRINNDTSVQKDIPQNNHNNGFSFDTNSRDGRSPIEWSDEEPEVAKDFSKMFDEKGVYNPNYDGYYNDILPKIQNEVDSLIAGREKTILKIVFGIVAIFGIIIYLILTI